MRVKVWGCRGSLPAPGPDTVRYGGNTSCVSVTMRDGTTVVLDAGSGLRPLGLEMKADPPRVVHILLSHLHLDHLQGLGFFAPLFIPGVEVHLWGPPSPVRSLRERIARYLSPPLFPVRLGDIPASLHFHDAPSEGWSIGAATVRAQPVAHQGPTVGYRISENGTALAYIPDHEPARGIPLGDLDPSWISGHEIARDADVLLHDSQYTEDEYDAKIGWGHSSVDHVVEFASIANAGRLVLFHHDPLHTDDQLEAKLARAREIGGNGERIELAREGMELELA